MDQQCDNPECVQARQRIAELERLLKMWMDTYGTNLVAKDGNSDAQDQ